MTRDLQSSERLAKRLIRGALKARLRQIDPDWAKEAAGQVARQVLALPELQKARRVFTCLSFGVEIDTWGLVERLLETGKEIYVPRTERGDQQVHVHRYPCPLRPLSFGLKQPRPGLPEIPADQIDSTLDVALILGLGFDQRGYRLGYGGGYFDRFLRDRPFPAIGLAFDLQRLSELPVEPHDIPMSRVVTESQGARVL